VVYQSYFISINSISKWNSKYHVPLNKFLLGLQLAVFGTDYLSLASLVNLFDKRVYIWKYASFRNLPTKDPEEAEKHRLQYEAMVEAAKKKGRKDNCIFMIW
jgi:hypothetical protein